MSITSSCIYLIIVVLLFFLFFFFFKQKTAYEMRISDWSSDVCSSDLPDQLPPLGATEAEDRYRAYPRRQSGHHLCPRQCLRRQGTRARQGRVRFHRLLGARRIGGAGDAQGARRPPDPAGAGLWGTDWPHELSRPPPTGARTPPAP